jgi:hypothetical protein
MEDFADKRDRWKTSPMYNIGELEGDKRDRWKTSLMYNNSERDKRDRWKTSPIRETDGRLHRCTTLVNLKGIRETDGRLRR